MIIIISLIVVTIVAFNFDIAFQIAAAAHAARSIAAIACRGAGTVILIATERNRKESKLINKLHTAALQHNSSTWIVARYAPIAWYPLLWVWLRTPTMLAYDRPPCYSDWRIPRSSWSHRAVRCIAAPPVRRRDCAEHVCAVARATCDGGTWVGRRVTWRSMSNWDTSANRIPA